MKSLIIIQVIITFLAGLTALFLMYKIMNYFMKKKFKIEEANSAFAILQVCILISTSFIMASVMSAAVNAVQFLNTGGSVQLNNVLTSLIGENPKQAEKFTTKLSKVYRYVLEQKNKDLIDLDDFGDRVIELGIYQPKFYPFISPYKSQWIPGIAIEDKQEGTRLIQIENELELGELEQLLEQSEKNGENSLFFKGEEIENKFIPPIIDVAKKQLANPETPITSNEIESEKDR